MTVTYTLDVLELFHKAGRFKNVEKSVDVELLFSRSPAYTIDTLVMYVYAIMLCNSTLVMYVYAIY